MNIYYGLGNNEQQYIKTKHNIGRVVIEKIAKNLGLIYTKKSSYSFVKFQDNVLLFSNGYMNNSGQPILDFINFFKPDLKDLHLIIIQDDSDQFIGNYKVVMGGGSGGHNGINSIYKLLCGNVGVVKENIKRIKIGIRRTDDLRKSLDFVLNPFSIKEEEIAFEIADKIIKKEL
jgi:peptidyl-tRNA hydrolase, PTH1 family